NNESLTPRPWRSLRRHHPTRPDRRPRHSSALTRKAPLPAAARRPVALRRKSRRGAGAGAVPPRAEGRWGGRESPSVPSAPCGLASPCSAGPSTGSCRLRRGVEEPPGDSLRSRRPSPRSPPPRRGRVFAPGEAGREGQVRAEDGVPRAAGARRRLLSGRVWSCSRRPSIPWTGSGSSVWLFCCSSWTAFNLETCRLMISMLDRDMSGTLGFNEFKELWAVVNGWKQHFVSFDSDRSGTVDRQELEKALTNMGFRLSPQAVSAITRRYSTRGKITFDDYIACCVKLRALTECFRRRDASQQGFVNFQYDDFIQCVMSI
uniref:Sorcin n=1 Tax=Phasianus colchicus TaxID=9054 RepID=A0A669QR18_PHACC